LPVSVEIRRGTDRYTTRSVGLLTRHSFAFGEHYDPDNVRFGPLVVHDEHLLAGGRGFDEHPHRDVEVVTWVVAGALRHSDSEGHDGEVRPGSVQVLSAGSGVTHSETAVPGAPARVVQAWLTPDETGTLPAYAVVPVDPAPGVLTVVASGSLPAPTRVGVAGATLRVARLGTGDTVVLPDEPRQHVFVAAGALARSSLAEPLAAGDAFRIVDDPGLELTAAVPTELLVWGFA
jgi:redox-sensitive bicupin YhaK (pirin superfamily)